MASMVDRGDSYRVQYLGSAMFSQTSTGLGVLQKPLRNLYFQYRQACARAPVQLQERRLMMTNKGMIMSYPGGQTGGANVPSIEDFHAMPSILFWDAVQFVVVKGHDKKYKAAFEPLDNDHSRNKDNLFSALDKQLGFLHGQKHPPLFTCVLRRTQGLKALDVHAFICYNEDEALGLVRALNTVHTNYASGEQQETGVFGYNPFGKESVRSTAGLQRDLSHRQQAGGPVSDRGQRQQTTEDGVSAHQFILRRPGEHVQDSQTHSSNAPLRPAASVRDQHSRTKSPARAPTKDYSRFTGSQPNLYLSSPLSTFERNTGSNTPAPAQGGDNAGDRTSRVFLLSQSDFQLNKPRPEDGSSALSSEQPEPRRQHSVKKSKALTAAKSNPLPASAGTYEYIQHIDKTLERPQESRPAPSSSQAITTAAAVASSNAAVKKSASARGRPPHYDSAPRPTDIANSAQKDHIEFSSGGIFREDPGSVRANKPRMGQGYGLLSGSQGPPPGYAPHQNSRQPYAPSPTHELEDRPSSTYQQNIPRNHENKDKPQSGNSTPVNLSRNSSVAQAYENISKFVDNHRSSSSAPDRQGVRPSGYPAPVLASHSPAVGKSESFRQHGSTSPERRPPSTTQGTVMAQVTPQDQRGAIPFANRSSPGAGSAWDKHSAGSTPNLRSNDATFSSPQSTHSKPVAMVPPHKIQGVKVLPSQPSLTRRDTKSGAPVSGDQAGQRNISPPDSFVNRPKSIPTQGDHRSGPPMWKTQSQYLPDAKGFQAQEVVSPSGDIYAMPRKGSQKSKQKQSQSKTKSESPSNWQFQKSPSKPEAGGRGTGEKLDQNQTEPLLVNQKKDAEIASALHDIHFDYEGTMSPHAPHRTNFEKSLGYFP